MAVLTEPLIVENDISGKTLAAATGVHQAGNFDGNGRRLALSVVHEHKIRYEQPSGANMAADARVIEIFLASGTVVEIATEQEAIPSGDRSWTIDLQKGSAASAFASILSGGTPIVMDSTQAARTPKYTIPATPGYVRGDSLKLVIALGAGSTGTHAQGGTVIVKTRENPA